MYHDSFGVVPSSCVEIHVCGTCRSVMCATTCSGGTHDTPADADAKEKPVQHGHSMIRAIVPSNC